MATKRKFVIDTDAGIDDAQALLMALAYPEKVEVIAITTTYGNTNRDQVNKNVLRLLKVADRLDIPVYPGSTRPLVGKQVKSAEYHGKDGFGDVPDPDSPTGELVKHKSAAEALIQLVNENRGEVELVCLGPLTNLALALKLDPDLGSIMKHCYIMGGNYEGIGNVTDTAEFNFYCDPESANIVLTELGCDITMACWELCLKYAFDWSKYEQLRSADTAKCRFLSTIESNIVRKHKEDVNWKEYICCDELAMAIAIDNSIVSKSVRAKARVELSGDLTRGQMVIRRWTGNRGESNPKNITYVTDIEFDRYFAMLEDCCK